MTAHTRKRSTLENLHKYMHYLEQDSECNPEVVKHVQAQIGKAAATRRASQNANERKRNSTLFGDRADSEETQYFSSSGLTACSD